MSLERGWQMEAKQDNPRLVAISKNVTKHTFFHLFLLSRMCMYMMGQAGNMRALRWNEELAIIAQRWADQCTWGHDQV